MKGKVQISKATKSKSKSKKKLKSGKTKTTYKRRSGVKTSYGQFRNSKNQKK